MSTPEISALTETPDYYSEQYNYQRFPAKIEIPFHRGNYFRAGHFCVWSRDVERPNPTHVTWTPEATVIVADKYRNEQWHAERAEQAARPIIEVGQTLRLNDVVIVVPKRAREHVSHVPCDVVA